MHTVDDVRRLGCLCLFAHLCAFTVAASASTTRPRSDALAGGSVITVVGTGFYGSMLLVFVKMFRLWVKEFTLNVFVVVVCHFVFLRLSLLRYLIEQVA